MTNFAGESGLSDEKWRKRLHFCSNEKMKCPTFRQSKWMESDTMTDTSPMSDRQQAGLGNPKPSTLRDAPDIAHRPLQGIRVVDLTHVLAGPSCTTILADLGAEVVKIERLGVGDLSRQVDPFRHGESYFFAGLNRNKRSVALDLKRDGAKRALEELVGRADVLVENYRPGLLERAGFWL
ncbi:CoA transferase [Bradyrhizobium sp. BR 1432]|uniref:CoA transferase n=1 Tax=Bradyrhizobium sp. BR 1432 TaxID=3447966 RepID=UPI003EE52AE2